MYNEIKDRGLLYPYIPIAKLPSIRGKGRFYEFHGTHGHTLAQYRDLKNQVEDLVRNCYLDEFVDRAILIAGSSCGAKQGTKNAGHGQPIVRVLARGLTLAGDSNISIKNYARYAMTSKEVFFNTPVAKRARTEQVPIMWTDEDKE